MNDTDDEEISVVGLVHEVHLDGELLAVEPMLARRVKVELKEVVGRSPDEEPRLPRRHGRLDGMPVVQDIEVVPVVAEPRSRGNSVWSALQVMMSIGD